MNAREKHYYAEGRRANRCVFCGEPPENSAHFPPATDADADAAWEDAKREMFGDDADWLDDDVGMK